MYGGSTDDESPEPNQNNKTEKVSSPLTPNETSSSDGDTEDELKRSNILVGRLGMDHLFFWGVWLGGEGDGWAIFWGMKIFLNFRLAWWSAIACARICLKWNTEPDQ